MKFLIVCAVLMIGVGVGLGDAILSILGTVALACAGSDELARHYQTRQ